MPDEVSAYSVEDDTEMYTSADLSKMTIAKIKELADEKGYAITKTVKAEIIEEFLAQQG